MEPNNWPGFDPSKVCPRCGGYQTRFMKSERAPVRTLRLFLWFLPPIILLPGLIGLTILLAGRRGTPKTVSSPDLLILVLIIVLVLLLFLRRVLPQLIESPEKPQVDGDPGSVPAVIYSLHCNNCGYRWQKTEAEWDQEGQATMEEYLHRPQPPGSEASGPAQGLYNSQAVQWEEPNPKRGVFLVISAIFLLCIVSAALLWMIYYVPYKGSSYYTIITTIGVLGIFWISIGVLFVTKSRLMKLVPVILLFLFFLVLRMFIK